MPDYPDAFWVIASLATILVGVAKAGFGGGAGVIATPLIALTIPVADSAAIMLPLLITCDVFSVLHYRHSFDRRSVFHLIPGAVIGIGIGAAFFGYFASNERVLQVGLGVLAILFVLFQSLRTVWMGMIEGHRPHIAEGIVMGAISGFTSTIAHAGGPPATIYLLPQKLPRQVFVGTTVMFFAGVNQVKLVPYIGLSFLRVEHLFTVALLLPLCYVGVKLGIFLNRRFSEDWFNRLVYVVLTLTGVQLILGQSLIAMVAGK